ncbi:anti-sigma factor antagonist [Spirochaetia bacterium]|nr:anti-sigma factor antagonist [Spirochaetia bacterium]
MGEGSVMANNDIVPGFDDEKDESLKIKLQKISEVDRCLVLYLTGYIDTYNSNYFQKRVTKAIEAGFIRLIFHCGGLNYVSSTGIGSFTAFLKSTKPKGGDLVLLEIQPKVYEVFQLLGFSQFFNIKDDLNDSVSFFRNGAPGEQAALFPKVFSCPICSKKLKALKAGRFRCSECKTILAIDDSGQVFLG